MGVSRSHGSGMRAAIHALAMSTLPDVYVVGGQADRVTLASIDRFLLQGRVGVVAPHADSTELLLRSRLGR